MSKFDINEAYIQALQEQEMKEARSHKEDNEKASPRQNVFDRNKEGVDQGVYDEEDTRNIKDRYREPLYARRNKVRKYQDSPKGKDMQDRLNKTLTHIDYEKSPNEKTLAYKKDKRQLGEAVALKERKKYWNPVWHTYEVDGYTFDFKCLYYEVSGSRQASLWGHEVELKMDYKTLSYYKVPYYNRTWETFTFQTCMLNALREYMKDVEAQLLVKYRQENNLRSIQSTKKEEILASNEWYQTLQKLYDLISDGDTGKVEENKQIKTESNNEELYSYLDANSYDKEEVEGNVYNYKQEAPNLEFKIFKDKSGMYFVEFIGTKQDLIDYLTKLGWYSEKEIEEQNLISPYIKKENKQIKTEEVEESDVEEDDPYGETISLLSIAYRDIPKVGVEDWGKDDELKFLIDTREFITYFDDFEVEIPKKIYEEASPDDWSNGVEEYLETFLGVNLNDGESDNTYNWGSRITHDMEICEYDAEDYYYVRASVHRDGDVRGNYTNDFLLRFDSKDDWYEACYEAQANCKNQIEYNGKHYTIEPDFWSEYCNIWCEEDNDGWDTVICENMEQFEDIVNNQETNNY